MKQEVYFEIYGKKLKVTVDAKDEEQAKYIVRGAIKFYKVKPVNDVPDFFKDIFNPKK
jgi:hypothetical protein